MFFVDRATAAVERLRHADVLRYADIWGRLVPDNDRARYDRWVFAIMSVRARWQENVKGYLACKRLGDVFTKEQLARTIAATGTGLYDRRVEGVWHVYRGFQKDPRAFGLLKGETMTTARTRLARTVPGLGMAKTSFVFEMLYPLTSRVVCLDTHMLQLYGYGAGRKAKAPGLREYEAVERHWVDVCNNRGVPSPVGRHLYWDELQKQPDPLYWAWCLREVA